MDQLKPERPMAVLVAKALGWTDFIQDKDEGFWWGTPPPSRTIPDPRPCPVPDYPNDPGEAIKALRVLGNRQLKIEETGTTASIWIDKGYGYSEEEDNAIRLAHAICCAIVEAAGGERWARGGGDRPYDRLRTHRPKTGQKEMMPYDQNKTTVSQM